MTEPQESIGSPLAQFIKSTKDQTIAGLGDWEIKDAIHVKLARDHYQS